MHIRICDRADYDQVVQLALRAWEPVFSSLEQQFSTVIFQLLYPHGWGEAQEKAVLDELDGMKTWVATIGAKVVGFVTAVMQPTAGTGEIHMIAVDPSWQGRGVGSKLTEKALTWMKAEGAGRAMVETGGDPSHLRARLLYESAGFRGLQISRYYKTLR